MAENPDGTNVREMIELTPWRFCIAPMMDWRSGK
jgi:hypothetical protein